MDMEAIINKTIDAARAAAQDVGHECEWGGNAVLMGNFKNQDRLPVVWIEMSTWTEGSSFTAWYRLNENDDLDSAETLEEAVDISGLDS